MVYGPRGEVLRLGPGGTDAEQRDEGRLGERRILAGGLAQLGRGCGSVPHVVVDLEREADVGAVAAQRRGHRRPGAGAGSRGGGGGGGPGPRGAPGGRGAPGAPGAPPPPPRTASAAANTRVGRTRLPAESRL